MHPVEPTPEVADADVSVVKATLTRSTSRPTRQALDEDVRRHSRRRERGSARKPVVGRAVPIPAQQMLSRTLRQPGGFGGALGYAQIPIRALQLIEVRVVPENVTNSPKAEPGPRSARRGAGRRAEEGRDPRDGAARLWGDAGPDRRHHDGSADGAKIGARSRKASGCACLSARACAPAMPRQIVRVVPVGERGIEAIAAINDRGAFVSVTPPLEKCRPTKPAPAEATATTGREEGGVAAL